MIFLKNKKIEVSVAVDNKHGSKPFSNSF